MKRLLNESQKQALNKLSHWWASPEQIIILNAPGGYGKTFLVNYFLNKVNSDALLLAPTHEALAQLRESIDIDVPSMTVHASLGIRPTVQEGTVEFREGIPHPVWGDVNLVIVDESSMLSQSMLDRIIGMKKKVLFLGHDAQLPPITEQKSIIKRVESPIFTYSAVPKLTLTIPMRNGGALHNYLVDLEAIVKANTTDYSVLTNEFDVTVSGIHSFIKSEEGLNAFKTGKANALAWTNHKVKEFNASIRNEIYGIVKHKYMSGDRVILLRPVNIPEGGYALTFSKLLKKINSGVSLHTNTPATVIKAVSTSIKFEDLKLSGIRITLETTLGIHDVIELHEVCYDSLLTFLERKAWGYTSGKDREKAYKDMYTILSSFAKLQHSYAVTAHRAQGRTIDTVIVFLADILKNPNRSEALRCWYTAASRASKKLMIYKGVS